MKVKKNSDDSVEITMTLRVLGYLEDKKTWAAHCLETNIVGFGSSFDEAMEELKELTFMQISFAVQKNELSLLDHPAPPHIWQTYEKVLVKELVHFTDPTKRKQIEKVGSIPFIPHKIDPGCSFVQA